MAYVPPTPSRESLIFIGPFDSVYLFNYKRRKYAKTITIIIICKILGTFLIFTIEKKNYHIDRKLCICYCLKIHRCLVGHIFYRVSTFNSTFD